MDFETPEDKIRRLENLVASLQAQLHAGGTAPAVNAAGSSVSVAEGQASSSSVGQTLGPLVDPGGRDEFSSVHIDKDGLVRLNDDETAIVQQVYKKVQCDNKKFHYMTGNPKFAMRKLNFKEPEQNVENIIVGKCQSGKSGEAAWVAWCTWFVLGCLPVILVRNSGGRSQGIDDMRRAIEKINEVVREHLRDLGVPADQHDKYLLTNFLTEEDQVPLRTRGFGHTGSILAVLNNPTHLRRLASHIPTRRSSQPPSAEAQLSVADRLDQYSKKNDRTRMVLIIDEADLVIGSPGRRGNASERWHFQERMRSGEMARGLRELVFGSVSITATPCALFLCSIKTIMCPYCDKFFGEGEACVSVRHRFDSEGESAIEHCHYAHKHCVQELVQQSTHLGQDLLCCKCCEGGAKHGHNNEDTESDSEEGSESMTSEEEASVSGSNGNPRSVEMDPADFNWDASSSGRKLKPHVVDIDVPDNYVRYTTSEDEEPDPWKIMRKETPERVGRVTKTQTYKRYFVDISGEFTEEMWMEKVQACKNGGPEELIPGFSLTCSRDGRVSVRAKAKRDAQMQEVFELVRDLHAQVHDSERTHNLPSAMRKDGRGIDEMVTTMMTSDDPFRYGLIISDNTKNMKEQDHLLKFLRTRYSLGNFCCGLAIVKWDCRNIKVAFTDKALQLRPTLVDDVKEKLVQLGVTLKSEENVDASSPPRVVIERDPRISYVLDALKDLCSRVVVITGEIGGRGVPYHSLDNQRILTDMFTGQNVPETTEVTAHGEYLIQLLGRLNTIHCNLDNPPVIRLWASPSVHKLHMHHLQQVEKAVQLVQRYKSYEEAYKRMPTFSAGFKPDGRSNYVHASRFKFRRQQTLMSQAGERAADLPRKRSREPDMGKAFLPPQSNCWLEAHLPLTHAGDATDHVAYDWTPDGGDWDEGVHTKWELGLNSLHVEEAREKFNELTRKDNIGAFEVRDLLSCEAVENGSFNCAFKTLKAAQKFIQDGAAGRREAALMRMHLLEPEDSE